MSEPLDVGKVEREGVIPNLVDVVKTLRGEKPICRAKYKSACCLGPVDVYMGPVEGTAENWSQPIIRVCVTCNHTCKGVDL